MTLVKVERVPASEPLYAGALAALEAGLLGGDGPGRRAVRRPPELDVVPEDEETTFAPGTQSASRRRRPAVGTVLVPALRVVAGRALVMVCTYDCGLDKEFNAVVDELTRLPAAERVDEDTAGAMAEGRTDLDRSFAVSPLVDPATVLVAERPLDRGLLMGGRIVGYLPVPELRIGDTVVVPESVVDLTYRSTLDRTAYTQRISCISEPARERLRFALAKLDALRTPSLEVQLSAAVGQQITSATVSRANPLLVELTLADGSRIELLNKPGSPAPGTPSRTKRSVRGSRANP